MASLFLLFALSIVLIYRGNAKHALAIAFIALLLCLGMLLHHATDTLKINL